MKLIPLAVAVVVVLQVPAEAAFVVTNKTEAVNSGSATLNSSSQSYTAGNVIVAMGIGRMGGTSDTLSVSGALSGGFTLYECNHSMNGATPTNAKTFIAWTLAAGGSEVVTLTASATPTAMFMQIYEIGGAAASSPEDVAVRACNGSTSNTTSPTVTSGAPSQAGELFMSPLGRGAGISGYTYTEDASNGWTQLDNIGGNTNVTWAGGYLENAGIGTKTHNPTTSSASYGLAVMGFKPVTPPTSCTVREFVIGGGVWGCH